MSEKRRSVNAAQVNAERGNKLFDAVLLSVVASAFLGFTIDDQLYHLLDTLGKLAIAILVIKHQRYVKKKIEPDIQDTAAVVKRQLGERDLTSEPPAKWSGEERRSQPRD